LAEHILPRRHVVDGQEMVVLFDQGTGAVVTLEPPTWDVLAAADGTRDVEGIRLAARRAGAVTGVTQIAELLRQLHEMGFVAGPTTRRGPPRIVIERTTPAERPIEALPGFALHCDRSGACCRNYATVLMTSDDVDRARRLLPEHHVGEIRGGRLFLPVAGSEPSELSAPAHRDGACGYLETTGACAIHRVGGLAAKPIGCAVFPVTFVDDGATIRASVKTECACVLDSVGGPLDEPLLDPQWQRAGDLPPLVAVTRLHERLAMSSQTTLPVAEARAFVDAWFRLPCPADVAAAAWAMAEALETRGPDAALRTWSAAPAADARAVTPSFRALHRRASRRARDNAGWRSERDAVRTGIEWIAAAALLLSDDAPVAELLADATGPAATEHFYLYAAAFGYALFDRPLAESLRDRAVRMWLARAMGWLVVEGTEAAHRQPLARVDALLRAYGIGNYLDDLATTRTGSTPSTRPD
jgi:lysine-N-methylase